MCRKLLLLIAVLGLVGTVWADDLVDPCLPDGTPWRGMPGSTYAEFTYDTAPPTGDPGWPIYAPTSSWYVPHPEKGDPDNYVERAYADGWLWSGAPVWLEYGEEGWWAETYSMPESHYETHALQLWTQEPTWMATWDGRSGVMTSFPAGSWDIFNFWSEQPEKYFQIQITWEPMNFLNLPEWGAEMEYFTLEPLQWIENVWWEPAGWNFYDDWYDGLVAEWPGGWGEWYDAWWEEGAWACVGDIEESFWRDVGGWEEDSAWIGGEEPVWNMLDWWDEISLVPEYEIAHEGDWRTSVFIIHIEPNPVKEFFGLFPSELIAIDQVVIDTICIPEPATIALLGLGGLALIRRRKR